MKEMRNLGDTLATAAAAIFDRVVAYLPSVFGAVLLLIVGWALARLLRALTMRAVLLLDKFFSRISTPAGLERLRIGRASVVLGTIVFWVVVLFFITAATQVLGLQAFTNWLARLVDYLPTLAAGLLIVAGGYLLSRFVSDLVHAAGTRLAFSQRVALARVVQTVILVGAILVGADQVGIKITFLAIFASAAAATVVGGVAIAVGFGAREYVANLIGAHHLKQAFPVGQVIRVGSHQGRVLEVTPTVIILETAEGRVTLPGAVYNQEPITVIARAADG